MPSGFLAFRRANVKAASFCPLHVAFQQIEADEPRGDAGHPLRHFLREHHLTTFYVEAPRRIRITPVDGVPRRKGSVRQPVLQLV